MLWWNVRQPQKLGDSLHLQRDLEDWQVQTCLLFFQELEKKMSRTEFELLAITCWIIWKARNKCSFEAKMLDPQMSVVKEESLIGAYQWIKVTGLILRDPKEKKKPNVSQPPPQNWFKVNVAAAINSEKQMSGLRVLIRDSTGNVMAAAIKTSKFYGDVAYAEAEAASWGLQVAKMQV